MRANSFLSLILGLFVLFNSPAQATSSCAKSLTKVAINTTQVLEQLLEDYPELKELYSEETLKKGIKWTLEAEHDARLELPQAGLGRYQDFIDLFSSPKARESVLKKWTQYDPFPHFIYVHLDEIAKDLQLNPSALLDELIKHSNGAIVRAPFGENRVLTYSFEKETHSASVSAYYKLKSYEDADWFALNEQERFALLKKNPEEATKTNIAPAQLSSKLQSERNIRNQRETTANNPPLEFKTEGYYLHSEDLLGRTRAIANHLNEKDAFHYHIVFEVPLNYAHTKKFGAWWKLKNDQAYILGLEEGLHPSGLTRLPSPAISSDLNLRTLGSNSLKYHSIGLRGKIYGFASDDSLTRIGVELRDLSRNQDKLRKYFKRIQSEISQKQWEGIEIDPALVIDTVALHNKVRLSFLDSSFTDQLKANDSTFLIPFNSWLELAEKSKKGDPQKIRAALDQYTKALQDLQNEVKSIEAKGGQVSAGDMQSAIRWNLTDWAKVAQISALYE